MGYTNRNNSTGNLLGIIGLVVLILFGLVAVYSAFLAIMEREFIYFATVFGSILSGIICYALFKGLGEFLNIMQDIRDKMYSNQ